MKISEDQNVVEFNGIKGRANAQLASGCWFCCFGSAQLHVPCHEIPCLPDERKDRLNVNFEIMEEQQ